MLNLGMLNSFFIMYNEQPFTINWHFYIFCLMYFPVCLFFLSITMMFVWWIFVCLPLNFVFDLKSIYVIISSRCAVYNLLESAKIEMPRYAILMRDDNGIPINTDFVELEDSIQIGNIVFQKPFVEKPIDAEDHNVFIYFPSSAGGGSQRLFRKVGSRSSIYSAESSVRKYGSYIYEDFVHTDGTDVKVSNNKFSKDEHCVMTLQFVSLQHLETYADVSCQFNILSLWSSLRQGKK